MAGIQEFSQDTVFTNPELPTDTLSSKQFNTLVEVVGEGEIEGSATASKAGLTQGTTAYNNAFKKDIFLNGTQLLLTSADNTSPTEGEFNFKDVGFEPRFGTSNQTFINGIANIETETSVGVAVTFGNPITRAVSNNSVNAIRVTVSFNNIQKVEDCGEITGASAGVKIEIIQNNGTTTTPIDDTVTGRSTSAYFRDYLINLPANTSFPINVRVSRTTADTTSPEFTAFSWSSMTEVIFKQNAYPDTAHLALRFSAESFPRIPKRSFRLRGIKTKIPHNATVDIQTGRITYAGTFNGTFKTDKEWHSDPAWVLWDILTNTRYGLSVAETSLDQYTFYNQSVYNNELVDDGEGGQEARFAINVNITQQHEAFNLINDICSVMRVMPFYAAGSISISGDRPSDPVYQFTLANVTEEGFTYSGSSLKTRHTVINVGYFDLETRAIDYETVEDTAAIAKYGTVVKTIKSFGCTSRGQASRMGKWFLYNEQKSGESCTFKITAESGTLVRCGQIISISDPVKAGLRRGGKIKSATTTSVVADDSTNTDLDSTNNATLTVIMPDGSLSTKTISSISGTTINVSSAFLNSSNQAEAPNANSVFVIQNDTLENTTWRVITVKENPHLTFDVTALSHDSAKYAFVEDGVALPTRTTTVLTDLKPAPSNLEAEEKIVVIDNKAVSKIFLNWQPVLGVNKYQVQYRFNNGNFISQNVISNTFDIENSQKGTYEIRVFSFNAIYNPSADPAILTVNALGKTALPDNPTNVRIEPIQNTDLVRVRFDQCTSLDVLHGGFVEIRHSLLTDGTGTFFTAQELDKVAGNSTSATLPKLDGEYILKFVDDTGNRSAGEGSAIIALPEDQTFLSALTRREDLDNPKFQGTKTNTELDSTNTFLQLQDLGFDSIINFNTLDGTATLDEVLTIASSGTYDFGGAAGTTFLDLGGVFNVNFKRHLKSNGFLPNDNFDAIQDLDLRQNFDGIDIANVSSDVLVAITQDDPSSGSPTYTAFQTFTNSNFKGRGFKFRCSMASTDPSASIKVTELGYTASFTRRTEQSPAVITSSGATDVTFQAPFFTGAAGLGGTNSALPSVAITSQNMQSGDFFELTNITGTGFRITFKNGSSTVNRNFTYQAVGFAKGG